MSASKQMLVHINLIYFNIEMQLTSENPFRHFWMRFILDNISVSLLTSFTNCDNSYKNNVNK